MLESISHKSIIIGVVALGVISFFIFGGGDRAITNYPSSGRDIILFGDSLAYGVGSNTGGMAQMLTEAIGETVINLGVSGNTTKDALERIDVLDNYKPKVVMIILGGNDFLRRVPEEETFANLDKIVSKVISSGSTAVLLGVRSGVLSNRHNKKYQDLAEKYGAVYVEDILEGVFGNSKLMYDSIHPNDAGYKIITSRLKPVLAKLIQ